MRRLILSFALVLVSGVALAQDVEGKLPDGANAQSVAVDTECRMTIGGKPIYCKYDPESNTWTPKGIADNNPAIANCLDAAAAGIYNADKIAKEFNTLLADYDKNKKETKSAIEALQEGLNALWDALADLDEDGEVTINECDLCNHATDFENMIVYPDGSTKPSTTTAQGCANVAKLQAEGMSNMATLIAENRTEILGLMDWRDITDPKVTDHENRIAKLENADKDFVTKVWAIEEHDKLARDTADVKFSLQAHIQNCTGGGSSNTTEIVACDLCSKTNGVDITDITFVGYKQPVGNEPAVPAHLDTKDGTARGCYDALNQVSDNVGELVTAVGTVLYLPERVETHIEWAEQDSAAQWEEISKNAFKEKTYDGDISSLAEALDPSNNKTVGGKVMFQPSASSTNYFTLEVGKLSYPPCEGVSSNEVEDIVKNYIESDGGGCTCTPDEYIKEETDPIWEKEKSSYATLQDLEEVNDILGSLIEQMQLEIEKLEGDIAIVQHMAETTITATKFLDERITALESLTNNITGGN